MSNVLSPAVSWQKHAIAVSSLGVGGLLYLAFRPLSLRMFRWASALSLDESVHRLRGAGARVQKELPEFVIYSLPNALWVLSMTMVLRWLVGGGPSWERRFWSSLPLAASSLPELAQACGVIPGTFDVLDLGLGVIGWLVGLLLSRDPQITRKKRSYS